MAELPINLEETSKRIEAFLAELLRLAGLQVTFEIQPASGQYNRDFENPDLVVNFDGKDAELLLENKGDLLIAIEHLVLEALHIGTASREHILFDCQDYRMVRVEELQLAAQAAAERVRRTGVPYEFNPMSSRERRIIHMALRGEAGVRTESEGLGPRRKVVIHSTDPKAARPQQKPHPPSR